MKKFKCPLCGSLLDASRYYQIIGVWEERKKLENDLKQKINIIQSEKKRLVEEKRKIKMQYDRQIQKMQKDMKKSIKEAIEKGKSQEKARADKLVKMLESKTKDIQSLNKKIKELQEQLKKGTTPQIKGLNFEEELVKELKKEFTEDKIEHHGKKGDILHYVILKNRVVGTILYECKKTDKFDKSFIEQTKKAMALRNATYGILVTLAFKKNTSGFWIENDVLVVHPYGAIYIAKVLRKSIIEINSLRISQSEIDKRSKKLLDYIKSEEFRNNIEDSIYRTQKLYEMLKREIKSHHGIWKERYDNYRKIHENVNKVEIVTSNIMKGIDTKKSLSNLRQLPPPEINKL